MQAASTGSPPSGSPGKRGRSARGGRSTRGLASERRTVYVLLKLTAAEGRLLSEKAAATGLPRTTYARRAALGARIVALRVPAIHLAAIGQLQRIGNNLNQSVKLVHEGRLSSEFGPALREVQRLLVELRRALRGDTSANSSPGDSE